MKNDTSSPHSKKKGGNQGLNKEFEDHWSRWSRGKDFLPRCSTCEEKGKDAHISAKMEKRLINFCLPQECSQKGRGFHDGSWRITFGNVYVWPGKTDLERRRGTSDALLPGGWEAASRQVSVVALSRRERGDSPTVSASRWNGVEKQPGGSRKKKTRP